MKDKTIDQMRFELMSAKDRQKNLKRFLKPSKIKERLYHGTIAHDEYADEEGQAFQQFTGRPTWLAGEPYTASGYSKGTGSTYPVYAQIKNPLKIRFDANDDAERAFPLARKLGVDVKYIREMRNPEKAWEIVNHPSFIDAVVNAGYDGIQIKEGGYKTYGVFSSSKIKSATGNRGTYDPSNPDITMAKGGMVHMADGGAINQGGGMPTLAEMRLALMRQNPVNLKNIGVNEATNMDQKVYLPPNRQDGVMHAGGVDMSHEVPGQQLMPLLPGTAPGQPGVPGQPPTGMAQGQMPGAQASPLPAGFNTQAAPNAFPPSAPQPQPPSNILSMLPQGRALNAMQPTKMPAMASGGLTKTYTHEVFNRKTGETKGQYQSIETARKARDRYDNQYGAYVHDVRPTGNVKPRPFENSKQALLRDLKSGTADQYMTGVERFQQRAADRLKEPKLAEGGSARPKFSIKPAEEPAKEPDQFSAYDSDNPSVPSLAQAFDEAIKHHLSLSPEERAKNSVRASEKVGDIIGRTSSGKVKDLLGKNAKLLKSEKGKDDEAIKLPDGRGVETTGLALSPAYRQGKFDTCPNHHSCKDECLGKTSGNYFKLGGGQDLSEFKGPRLNSLLKTHAFLQDPHSFAVKLHDEIHDAKAIAAQNGNHLGVRLNVLSDINPRVHKAIIHAHPDVTFYDYTKNNTDPIAENHHYTYSSTGASQPGVENEHTNWKSMRRRLDKGDNVAMAFSHKDHLPEHVHDQETGKKYRVVNGDTHDFRPLDLQPEGEDGVIIGLKNKKATGKMNEAHIDSRGFFMHYDPQLKMAKNKKGVPIYERDKNGNTIPQNKTVSIQPQAHKMIPISNDDGEKV